MTTQEEKKTETCPCGEFVYEKEGWDKEEEYRRALERKHAKEVAELRKLTKRRDGRGILFAFLLGLLVGMLLSMMP